MALPPSIPMWRTTARRGLIALGLAATAVAVAPPASSATCPTGFSLVAGTTDVCELRFTSPGSQSWTVPTGVTSIDFLVVGAGGGGGAVGSDGSTGGGGGGGGAVWHKTGYSVTAGASLSIVVGTGGAGGSTSAYTGSPGTSSSLGTFTANAGGGGWRYQPGYGPLGGSGGSRPSVSEGSTGGNGGDGSQTSSTYGGVGVTFTGGLFAGSTLRTSTGGVGAGAGCSDCRDGANPGDGGGGKAPNVGGSGYRGADGIVIIRAQAQTLTAPGTPTISAITAGDQQLSVAFTVSDGGSALTGLEFSIDGGSNWSSASGTSSPLTITGLTNGVAYDVQVKATNAQGTGPPSATTSATPLGTALTPMFGSVTRTTDGFTVPITNFDAAYTWTPSSGIIDAATGVLAVSGLAAGTSATVTVGTVRPTYAHGSATVTGQALSAALVPTFATPVRTADGFTASITNYDATFTWSATSGTIDSSGLLTVTGLAASATGTVAVSTSRSGFVDGSATVTGQALDEQTITWSPTNTAATMAATTIRPSSGAVAAGAITYSVHDAGTTGCTVTSSSTPATWPIDIQFTAPGTCTVRADAAATGTYAAASTDVAFIVSLVPQTITASATATRLQPGQSATVSESGTTGSGAITWTNSTPAVCTLTGTTVTADVNGSCVLTVSIAADATYSAASDTITISVTTPSPSGGGGSGGSSSGGAATDGSTSGIGGTPGSTSPAGQAPTLNTSVIEAPGGGSSTKGRALPPPPIAVEVKPASRTRSSVLIKQPAGSIGSSVTATVVVVRDTMGKIVSRINIEPEPGQTQVRVTVPFVADGYTVNVYNVNEVGVSTGALRASPLIKATTITKPTTTGRPSLFGSRIGKPVIFAGASAALDAGDRRQLRAIAAKAKKSTNRLFVTGFARKGGGPADELAALSTKRARAVATYLSTQGVRVWIRYWGAGSLNGTGNATDRRVEIRTSSRPIPRSLVP